MCNIPQVAGSAFVITEKITRVSGISAHVKRATCRDPVVSDTIPAVTGPKMPPNIINVVIRVDPTATSRGSILGISKGIEMAIGTKAQAIPPRDPRITRIHIVVVSIIPVRDMAIMIPHVPSSRRR